jgi:hypothetical protein
MTHIKTDDGHVWIVPAPIFLDTPMKGVVPLSFLPSFTAPRPRVPSGPPGAKAKREARRRENHRRDEGRRQRKRAR